MKSKKPNKSFWQYDKKADLSEYAKIKQKWGFDLLPIHEAISRLNYAVICSVMIAYVDIDSGECLTFNSGENDVARAYNRFVNEVKIDWFLEEVFVVLAW